MHRPIEAPSHRRFPDTADAFLPDATRTHEWLLDDEAGAIAQEFVASITGAEDVFEDARDELLDEETYGLVVDEEVESSA